jgi:hypothetical protein
MWALLSTVVDKHGRGRITERAPSATVPDILTPELRLSSGDHKKGLLWCLMLRMGHRIQECKKETKFRKICLLSVLFLLTN